MIQSTRVTLIRVLLAAALTSALVIAARADAPAPDATSIQAIFDNRGLTISDVWLVLTSESAVHNGVVNAKQQADTIHKETTSRRDLRFDIQKDRHDLETLTDGLVAADRQINRLIATRQQMSKDDRDYNSVIEMFDAVAKHRNALSEQISNTQKALDDANTQLSQVPDSRATYANLVMDVAAQAESAAKVYARLSQDSELTHALTAANVNAHPPLKLGPSVTFSADLDYLRKAVKDVVDSPVAVRRGDDGGLYVQAVLNGKVPDEMAWDSGASTIMLSANTARELGIAFTDQNRQIDMLMADGKTQKAREAVIDSVRLGGFTVKNVICLVLPDGTPGNTTDLLGDTFQTHFVSRMDQRSQQLQLTPVDSSVQVGPVPQAPQP